MLRCTESMLRLRAESSQDSIPSAHRPLDRFPRNRFLEESAHAHPPAHVSNDFPERSSDAAADSSTLRVSQVPPANSRLAHTRYNLRRSLPAPFPKCLQLPGIFLPKIVPCTIDIT